MGYSVADLEWLTTGELNAMVGDPAEHDADDGEPDDSIPTLGL